MISMEGISMKKTNTTRPVRKKQQRPIKFKKTEATRLVRATLAAGLGVDRIELQPVTGLVIVYPKVNQHAE
jgi:hypothetical protein